jgi:hypothetical protein
MADKKSASKKAAPKTAAKAPAKSAKAPGKPAVPREAAKPSAAEAKAGQAHEKDVERKLEKAEHQHQDPRGAKHQHNPAAQGHGMDPRKDQGAIKDRGAGRVNKVVNWFRRGRGR